MLLTAVWPFLLFVFGVVLVIWATERFRYVMRGTHQGELMGIPPTGNRVEMTGMYMSRLSGGKIVEEWYNPDILGLMRQLGVIPPPG